MHKSDGLGLRSRRTQGIPAEQKDSLGGRRYQGHVGATASPSARQHRRVPWPEALLRHRLVHQLSRLPAQRRIPVRPERP